LGFASSNAVAQVHAITRNVDRRIATLERAEEACRRVSLLEPESVTGPLCLGEALRRQHRLEEAGEALEAAHRIEPDHPDVAKLAARLAQ